LTCFNDYKNILLRLNMTNKLDNVPALKELAGEWKGKEWLAHLPSVRNQLGQALVNADMSSVSWLASPPFACGYHTGVLIVNGKVPLSDQFRWYPYQALRRTENEGLKIESSTRMLFDEHGLAWRIVVENTSKEKKMVNLTQDCMALMSKQENNWGWLYGQPWKNGIRHDYFTAESLRASIDDPESHQFMLSENVRPIVIGSNVPVRDSGNLEGDDDTPMLCETELPMHTTPAGKPVPKYAFIGEVKALRIYDAAASSTSVMSGKQVVSHEGVIALENKEARHIVDELILPESLTIQLAVKPVEENGVGYILSHGNQPESMQLSLRGGCLRLDMGGDYVESAAPLPLDSWSQIMLTFDGRTAKVYVDESLVAETTPWWEAGQWQSSLSADNSLQIVDTQTGALSCYAFATVPDTLKRKGSGGEAEWAFELGPGESKTIEYVLHYGEGADAVCQRASQIAKGFAQEYDNIAEQWEQRWRGMFTPGAGYFSGHLPILETDDEKLNRVYYMGPLTLLYMLRTGLPVNDKVFLSGGPRLGPTVTFLWDCAIVARLFALLAPEELKHWLRSVLQHDIDTFFALDNYEGHKIGNRYVSNHTSVFRLVYDYLSITGDKEFLHEKIGNKTVLAIMEKVALGWQPLSSEATGGKLADFGPDHWDLLECVPNYKHVVVSFNASYIGMTRKLSEIFASLGQTDKATQLRAQADELAQALLELYAGEGHWLTRHPDGDQVVHHCLDFQYVTEYVTEYLPDDIKQEMVAFVQRELFADTWMRAQSLSDPVAEYSDRPDHGPLGVYDGHVGETAYGLVQLGRHDVALDLLRRIYPVTLEGSWAQSREFFQDPKSPHAPVRIAERGANCRDAVAGAVISKAVISGIFAYQPAYSSADGLLPLAKQDALIGFTGTLYNVVYRGVNFDISCNNGALSGNASDDCDRISSLA
jgi:hypothetical protein